MADRATSRRRRSFCVLDCGSIAESLIESELFGHERGAFTGAVSDREGIFERARGGTVFLDEIGELPLPLQTRLLRVLDRREVKRVGGGFPRRVDVRLVAATNRDLAAEVSAGRFREDLYYRLAVIRVVLPPLRDRREDIPLLARHFLWQAGCAEPEAVLTPRMVDLLCSRQWRGNVRELRNALERSVVLSDGGIGNNIQEAFEAGAPASHASLQGKVAPTPPPAAPAPPPGTGTLRRGRASDNWLGQALPAGYLSRPFKEIKEDLITRLEALYLQQLLDEHGNLTHMARAAGVDRQIIRRMLRRHGKELGGQ